jgi:hypothetical protein
VTMDGVREGAEMFEWFSFEVRKGGEECLIAGFWVAEADSMLENVTCRVACAAHPVD